jgi:hypothetical protein
VAAPAGNQFWKLRLKHGRDHKIETAQQIDENFEEYAQWIENSPLNEVDFRGKDATEVVLPKMRAMTKDHFSLACGLSGWDVLESYKERGEDFKEVITRIEKFIYYQKFAGSAAGFLNPNIIARDLGLTDKKEHDVKLPDADINITIVKPTDA